MGPQKMVGTMSPEAEGRPAWVSAPSVDSSLGTKLLPTVHCPHHRQQGHPGRARRQRWRRAVGADAIGSGLHGGVRAEGDFAYLIFNQFLWACECFSAICRRLARR